MVAFVATLLISVLLIAPIFPYAKRRPVGTPLTWGEAVVGGTYVFFVMFWIYGVMPHHWLQWADAELNWRPDRIWFGPNGEIAMPITGWSLETPWFPIAVSAQVFRDIIATMIYVVPPGRPDLDVGLVAEPGQAGRGGRGRRAGVDLRPSAHEAGLRTRARSGRGSHRRQSPDAGVPRRLRPPGGRRGLPGQGGQAEAVHPHRPVRVHHVRGLRRHLPVEVHLHGHAARRSRSRSASTSRGSTRPTRSCS